MAMLWKDPGWDSALLCLGPPIHPQDNPRSPTKGSVPVASHLPLE